MTNNDLIIAVAKLDDPAQCLCFEVGCPAWKYKDCLTSRDAIIPVIEKLCDTRDRQEAFIEHLIAIEEPLGRLRWFDTLTTAPKQLTIALVKATGNYHEQPTQQTKECGGVANEP